MEFGIVAETSKERTVNGVTCLGEGENNELWLAWFHLEIPRYIHGCGL